jgi:proline iminopeptidase
VSLLEYPLAEVVTLEDGRAVEWEAVGDGPPLMWVEGGPGFWAHLARPDVALVSDLFRCHLVNAPGCGRTSPPAGISGYALPAIIAFFEQVRDRLGLGQVTVMGHSWGGLVAAAWAGAHAESVNRLVVIDGYPGRIAGPGSAVIAGPGSAVDQDAARAERERAYARHASQPWYDAAVRALAEEDEEEWDEEEPWIRHFDPAWPMYFTDPAAPLAAAHLARVRTEARINVAMANAWFGDAHHFDDVDILPSLAGVRCPSLVIAGQDDFIAGPAWNRPIAAAIPAARYTEIADAGHIPQYEQPEAFRAALLDWLATT